MATRFFANVVAISAIVTLALVISYASKSLVGDSFEWVACVGVAIYGLSYTARGLEKTEAGKIVFSAKLRHPIQRAKDLVSTGATVMALLAVLGLVLWISDRIGWTIPTGDPIDKLYIMFVLAMAHICAGAGLGTWWLIALTDKRLGYVPDGSTVAASGIPLRISVDGLNPRHDVIASAWGSEAVKLYCKEPVGWGLFISAWAVAQLVVMIVPIINLLSIPVFHAGLNYAAAAADGGNGLRLSYLLAGFKMKMRQLNLLGILWLAIISVVWYAAASLIPYLGSLQQFFVKADENIMRLMVDQVSDPYSITGAISFGFCSAIAACVFLSFSPALVMLGQLKPLQAVKLSIKAAGQHIVPIILYCFAMVGVYVAAGTVVSGYAWVLVFVVTYPLSVILNYVAFKAIFTAGAKV